MRKIVCGFLAGVMLLGGVPAQGASASAPADGCAAVSAGLGATFQEGRLGKAAYCVIAPAGTKWNHDLVLFAHGYVPQDAAHPNQAPEIPWEQVARAELNLPKMVVNLGYAFAITSYSKTGLAVSEGVQDVVALARHLQQSDARIRRVFLAGASEGGLIATLALERHPALFSGGLATCGPIGDFQKQINGWGDLRVVFDHYFPRLLQRYGGSAVEIPPALIAGWGSVEAPGPLMQEVYRQLRDPEQRAKAWQVVSASGAAVDLARPEETLPQTVVGILDYNIKATNEGKAELGGNPYFNRLDGGAWQRAYTSHPADPTLNLPYPRGVARFEADAAALARVQSDYQTRGALSRPLVLLHTTADPIVPFWHARLYLEKAARQGALHQATLIPVVRYGHCNFTAAEAVFAFYILVLRATHTPLGLDQVSQALPEAADQEAFLKLVAQGPQE